MNVGSAHHGRAALSKLNQALQMAHLQRRSGAIEAKVFDDDADVMAKPERIHPAGQDVALAVR